MNRKIGEINPDYIFSFVDKGIARASGFVGAVLNNKNCLNINRWCIDETFAIIPELTNEKETLEEFKSFIVKNSLCEMIMLFETTLIKLQESILLFENTRNGLKYNVKTHQDLLKKFINKDFDEKIKKINEILDSVNENKELWRNLKYTRNCIAHNHSLVDKGTIKLVIPFFTAKFVNEETGEECYSDPDNPIVDLRKFAGYPLSILLNYEPREKVFHNGDIITFTKNEILFLIFTMKNSVDELRRKYYDYLLKNNYVLKFKNGIAYSKEDLDNIASKRILKIEVKRTEKGANT